MSPVETLAAYEALLSRAVAFARGVGEMGPTHADPDERWLTLSGLGLRLHWGHSGDGTLFVPFEAFAVEDPDFPAWVLNHRVEREERREANDAAFGELLNRIFGVRP